MARVLFTSETAKAAAARSVAARKAKRQRMADILAAAGSTATAPDWVTLTLGSVRLHIERIVGLLEKETNSRNLRDLASALRSLQEQERQLGGRPLPSRSLLAR